MRRGAGLGLVAVVVAAAAVDLRPVSGQAGGEPPERAVSRTLARAVDLGARHLVAIRPADDAARRRARSGVVVAPDLVATCASNVDVFGLDDLVVEDAGGQTLPATVRGRDLRLRVVVLRVPGLGLPAPAPVAERRAGAFVLALGAVLDGPTAPTATQGIVSAVGRFEGRADQVDAPLDASAWGGPLVDLEGRLIGVTVHVDPRLGERSGVGFAVPVPRVLAVLERLAQGDQLEAGWLGVVIPRHDDGEPGVPVRGVVPNSAAAAAGLQAGDRIVGAGGREIPGRRAFREWAADLYAGQAVELEVLRGGAPRRLELSVAPRR
ncbi:MAG: S1C family serine protease [Planctomycetes bacterium]|nr:S1C family serine protease [Planctomycetota bacterium]